MGLKTRIKSYAYDLGADLVGIGSVEDRCKDAPIMMSPQGVFPGAKSVVVMAIHHPDACIELGGEEHPQDIGPYSVQYLMNERLDEMSYRMATFIEKQGYGAIPIAASNIWRYNSYKHLKAIFAPDVSNIYMPVVAGLADMGYNGLALSPEYGARNRFLTVITDAEISPDPLIPPGTVCDSCMLCKKHCPTNAFDKEVDGQKVLKIGDYEYTFPNKNLWRCSWGEHFDLDLDLDIPDVVDEQTILEVVNRHGTRSGEMGQCLKFCVPKKHRTWDRNYSRTPLRKLPIQLDESAESRAMMDRILTKASQNGAEYIAIFTKEQLSRNGIDLDCHLPGAQSAILLAAEHTPEPGNNLKEKTDWMFNLGYRYTINALCYDATREIESLGFRSLMTIKPKGSDAKDPEGPNLSGHLINLVPLFRGKRIIGNTIITRKTMNSSMPENPQKLQANTNPHGKPSITQIMHSCAKMYGADLVGFTSVQRVNKIADQISAYFDGTEELIAKNRSGRFKKNDPEISVEKRFVTRPADYLANARTVIVIGMRYHREVVRWATRPPAEAAGPYAFQTYSTNRMGCVIASRLVTALNEYGYHGVLCSDLLGTSSSTANPRGYQPDVTSNRFVAVAAGLGYLAKNGIVVTPEFGIRQRFIAIITDAPLDFSSLLKTPEDILCKECGEPCISACPSQAFSGEGVSFELEGNRYCFTKTDLNLCNWSKRYVLTGKSGFQYLGSNVDIDPEKEVTNEKLANSLRTLDPIKKIRPVVAEPCIIECPLANYSIIENIRHATMA